MDRQDLWIILLTPFAAIAIMVALGTGECKRNEAGTIAQCAADSFENFGDQKFLYEDHLRALSGQDK